MTVLQRLPRRFLQAAFWCACLAIGGLALLPAAIPQPTTGWDKANHALAFAVLAWLGAACWPGAGLAVLLGLATYGGAIEFAQAFTATRVGEFSDWLADCAGLAIAAAYLAWRRREPRAGG